MKGREGEKKERRSSYQGCQSQLTLDIKYHYITSILQYQSVAELEKENEST